MEKLNEYLQTLLSSCSDELHLEPNKNPYLVAENRTREVANTPLLGTQISTMVFPLIPPDVKSSLPHSDEIEFVHPHNLGNFNFTVQKSSAGFNVTIRPLIGESDGTIQVPRPLPTVAAAPVAELGTPYSETVATPEPEPVFEPESQPEPQVSYDFESSSAAYDLNTAAAVETSTLTELLLDQKESAPEYIPAAGGPEIEIVSVNDGNC